MLGLVRPLNQAVENSFHAPCLSQHEVENISECNMYRLGFRVYGDKCRFKHIKYPGPPPEPGAFEASKPKQFRKKGDP